jgi:CRISPR/Cas system-associated endoribonuclease Cas2
MHKLAKAYGRPLQYSVFSCLLRPADRVLLAKRIESLIDGRSDRVVLIDLGSVADRETWIPPVEAFGQQDIEPETNAIIA